MKRNNGVVLSELSGQELVTIKNTKGVTSDPNGWQIDHVHLKRKVEQIAIKMLKYYLELKTE